MTEVMSHLIQRGMEHSSLHASLWLPHAADSWPPGTPADDLIKDCVGSALFMDTPAWQKPSTRAAAVAAATLQQGRCMPHIDLGSKEHVGYAGGSILSQQAVGEQRQIYNQRKSPALEVSFLMFPSETLPFKG